MKPTAKIIVISAFLAFCSTSLANELLVPSQYPTIQSAIDAAVDGDAVIVAPGTYTGSGNRDIDFLGKAITVRSTAPNDPNIVAATIIDCDGSEAEPHRGFCFYSGEDANSVLSGLTITNGHMSSGGGGGICVSGSPTITKCFITGNSAFLGGGISGSDGVIRDCIISNNTAGEGGGLFLCAQVINCTITGNTASIGGGLSVCDIISDCVISKNSADHGGGVSYFEGAMSNCLVSGNSASYGGGFWLAFPRAISNCTIVGNSARHEGGAVCKCYNSALSNCIIWENIADVNSQLSSSMNPSYCCIQGWSGGGVGNIDSDPCFVVLGYWNDNGTPEEPNDVFWVDGDYHLKSQGWRWDSARGRWDYDDITSRCIDAGNPGSPLGDELLSVPDDPDNIWGQNLRIDMGAYGGTAEASMSPYDWAMLGDLTNDGLVDLKDYAFQAADWLNSADQQPGDLNRDGLIDIDDLALLVEDWLGQTTWH
jgi:hypothetical protein